MEEKDGLTRLMMREMGITEKDIKAMDVDKAIELMARKDVQANRNLYYKLGFAVAQHFLRGMPK